MSISAGANPDELEQLAGKFGAAAASIAGVQRSLNPQINTSPWQGRNADRFRHEWSGEHRRAIADAINFLNDGADVLRRNAREQRDASRAARGSPFARAWESISGTVRRPEVTKWVNRLGVGSTVLSALAFAGSNAAVSGRYTNAWRGLISLAERRRYIPDGLFRFKQSPALQFLHRAVRPGAPTLQSLDGAFRFAPYLASSLSAVEAINTWREGDRTEAMADLSDAGSGLIKSSSKGHPVTYLVGVNVSAWTEVVREGRKVDWTPEGLELLRSASAKDWASAFGEAATMMPGKLTKIFL